LRLLRLFAAEQLGLGSLIARFFSEFGAEFLFFSIETARRGNPDGDVGGSNSQQQGREP
jgi:hypothetical protein